MEVSYESYNQRICLHINMFFRPYTYRDCIQGGNSQEFSVKVTELKEKLAKLDEYEQKLDLHKLWVTQSIKNITEDLETKQYLYVTKDDLLSAYESDQIILLINTPVNQTSVKFKNNSEELSLNFKAEKPIVANLLRNEEKIEEDVKDENIKKRKINVCSV